ncbi:MAG: BspA family leucine-rich repeat surface protein [Bacteroidota bacterium]
MKLNTILLALVAGAFLLSCSSDDGGTTPVNPNPGTENTAPKISAISFSKPESISDEDVIGNVQATDDDGDELEYEITSNSKDLFEIADNGDLSLVSGVNLDFEDAQQHMITVNVSDADNQVSAVVTINVENVIENLFEDPESFITTWKTPADGFELVIGTDSTLDYNFTIDWGDGSDEETFVDLANVPSHVYDTEDTYTVAIKGAFPAIKMYEGVQDGLDDSRKALTSINQWGAISWESFEEAFRLCINLSDYMALDAPNLEKVESLAGMFRNATSFSGDLSNWNTVNVVNMSEAFRDAVAFNGAIVNWNTSNVIDMNGMFNGAESFNQEIDFDSSTGAWDTSNVVNMAAVFQNAKAFNQNIGNWKTDKVTNMFLMFRGASDFNQNISSWDVSEVTSFTRMFENASGFNQNLGSWNISSTENMSNMFNDTSMSSENYSNTLIGWDGQGDIPGDITLGAVGLKYLCSANVARSNLLGRGWNIEDDGSDPAVCP